MHELSLYGSVPAERHDRLVQQLAGVCCMQPQHAEEIHLVFKARQPVGLEKVQGSGSSQANSQQQQDVQKLRTMLQSGVYFVQLVGTIVNGDIAREDKNDTEASTNGNEPHRLSDARRIEWAFEFKDTPEAGLQAANTRLISRTSLIGGELIPFLDLFGFEYVPNLHDLLSLMFPSYVQRYYVEGKRFYNQETALFLHRIRVLLALQPGQTPTEISNLPPFDEYRLLDASESWTLEASIEITDGKAQELRDRATRQLMSMRETLLPSVRLEKPDRLALDTRIPVRVRQI